jgi:hypothetical protein
MTDSGLTMADGHNHALAILRSPLAAALAPDVAPPVFPSHDALMSQAAFITEVAQDAKLAEDRRRSDAVVRARQQRDRRRRLEQLPASEPAGARSSCGAGDERPRRVDLSRVHVRP